MTANSGLDLKAELKGNTLPKSPFRPPINGSILDFYRAGERNVGNSRSGKDVQSGAVMPRVPRCPVEAERIGLL